MLKFIKDTKELLDLIDKSKKFQFILINIFFVVNAVFQLLFVLTFYLLIQSFTNQEKFLSNELIIKFSQLTSLDGNIELLNKYIIILFFIIVILSNILLIISNSLKFHFSYDLLTQLRSKVYNYYVNQNFSKFIKKNSAEYINVIMTDCERFAMQIMSNILSISLTIISLIFIIAPLLYINFTISIFAFCFIFLLFYFTSSYLKPLLKGYGFKIKNYSKNRYEILNETFRNFKEIKLENLVKYFKNKYLDKESSINKIGNKLSIINHSSKPIIEIILIGIFFILYLFFFDKHIEIIQYFDLIGIVLITLYKLLPLANSSYQSVNEINHHKIVMNNLNKNLLKNEKNQKYIYKNYLPEKINQIEFKNISFKYDQKSNFKLHKINLTFEVNHITGIEGDSGVGKTTLFNILTGLLKPDAGNIYINKKKENIFDNPNWFKKISYVSQNVNIFNDTIYKNISYNLEKKETFINKKNINNILRSLNLNKFLIEKIILDEFGNTISGGQLQRVAIARALFKDSQVIIFDEPTRNLDAKNELKLLKIIQKLKKNKIILFISHNKKNLTICDKIIKLRP